MSDITSILSGSVNLRRNTPYVVDNVAVAASVVADRNPRKASRIEVKIVGATVVTGLVELLGDASETLNFSENGVQVGSVDFATLTGLSISGITQGFVKARALNRMGQPINSEIDVQLAMPVKFYAQDGRIRMMNQGKEQVANYKLIAEPDVDIQANDLIYAVSGIFGLTFGQVTFSEKIFDFDGSAHHTEAEIMDL